MWYPTIVASDESAIGVCYKRIRQINSPITSQFTDAKKLSLGIELKDRNGK